jgi:hypothetical protein
MTNVGSPSSSPISEGMSRKITTTTISKKTTTTTTISTFVALSSLPSLLPESSLVDTNEISTSVNDSIKLDHKQITITNDNNNNINHQTTSIKSSSSSSSVKQDLHEFIHELKSIRAQQTCSTILLTILMSFVTITMMMTVLALPTQSWYYVIGNSILVLIVMLLQIVIYRSLVRCQQSERWSKRSGLVSYVTNFSLFGFYLYVCFVNPDQNLCVSLSSVLSTIENIPCPWDISATLNNMCISSEYESDLGLCISPTLMQQAKLCTIPSEKMSMLSSLNDVSVWCEASLAIPATSTTQLPSQVTNSTNDLGLLFASLSNISDWMTVEISTTQTTSNKIRFKFSYVNTSRVQELLSSSSSSLSSSLDASLTMRINSQQPAFAYFGDQALQCTLLTRQFCIVPTTLPPFIGTDSSSLITFQQSSWNEVVTYIWSIGRIILSLCVCLFAIIYRCVRRCCYNS